MSLYTALITPFKNDGVVDMDAISRLLDMQFDSGVDKVVIFGTTGEAPTLDDNEKFSILGLIVSKYNNNPDMYNKFVIGFSGNDTIKVISEMEKYIDFPFRYYMLSSPYYNKPSQNGLYMHFKTIMSNFEDKYFMIYNIPGRTGVNIEPDTMMRIINDTNNYFGVKEASGDIKQIKTLINRGVNVFSGDDSLGYEVVRSGGVGLVSVASNLYPFEMKHAIINEELNKNMSEMFKLEFIETNPVPIKYMMKKIGLIGSDKVRLPLVELEDDSKNKINKKL